jgi:hypothetical protein
MIDEYSHPTGVLPEVSLGIFSDSLRFSDKNFEKTSKFKRIIVYRICVY